MTLGQWRDEVRARGERRAAERAVREERERRAWALRQAQDRPKLGCWPLTVALALAAMFLTLVWAGGGWR